MKTNIIDSRIVMIALGLFLYSKELSSADVFAITTQGDKVILRDDGTWYYENQKREEKHQISYSKAHFFAEDGYGKLVKVEFSSEEGLAIKFEEKILKKAVLTALSKTKYKAKNPLSYIPRKVHVRSYDANQEAETWKKFLDDQYKKNLKEFGEKTATSLRESMSKLTTYSNGVANISVNWLAKNAYGAEGEEASIYTVNKEGDIVSE